MTHRFVDQTTKDILGLHDGFFRLSVGLEDPDDLEADLYEALRWISPSKKSETHERATDS